MATLTPNLAARSMPGGGPYVQMSLCLIINNDLRNAVWVQVGNTGWTKANGTNHWSLPLTLLPATNTVRAYALDTSGNDSLTTIATINYMLTAPLIIVTNGLGTLSPNDAGHPLRIGQNYSMTATPAGSCGFRVNVRR
jgi:hypothetical protein